MAEHVENALRGSGGSGDVSEVACHEGPQGHDAPGESDQTIRRDEGGDGGGCGRPVRDQSIGWGRRQVVVTEAEAEENGYKDECRHRVEALDLGGD